MTDLAELMRQHADYMATVTDFVGSPDAIERALLKGADEIERLRALLDKGLFLSVDETISAERRIQEAAAWVKEVRAALSVCEADDG